MRYGSLSSKIQPAAADVARPDIDVSEGRSGKTSCIGCRYAGNQGTLSLYGTMDRMRGCNGRELRLGVQLGVRRMAGDRRSLVLRGREGEERSVQAGKIPVCGLATSGI